MAKASDNVFPKLIYGMQTANPAAPGDSSWKTFAKADGIYARSSNTVVGPFGTSSGGSASFHGAKVYNAGTQSGTPTVVLTFASEEYDTDAFHDTGSNTSRLTVGTTGKYMLAGGTSQSGTNSLYLYFRLNGSTQLRGTVQFNGHSIREVVTVTSLSATDYVELIVTNVGSETYGHASDLTLESWASITFLGS